MRPKLQRRGCLIIECKMNESSILYKFVSGLKSWSEKASCTFMLS